MTKRLPGYAASIGIGATYPGAAWSGGIHPFAATPGTVAPSRCGSCSRAGMAAARTGQASGCVEEGGRGASKSPSRVESGRKRRAREECGELGWEEETGGRGSRERAQDVALLAASQGATSASHSVPMRTRGSMSHHSSSMLSPVRGYSSSSWLTLSSAKRAATRSAGPARPSGGRAGEKRARRRAERRARLLRDRGAAGVVDWGERSVGGVGDEEEGGKRAEGSGEEGGVTRSKGTVGISGEGGGECGGEGEERGGVGGREMWTTAGDEGEEGAGEGWDGGASVAWGESGAGAERVASGEATGERKGKEGEGGAPLWRWSGGCAAGEAGEAEASRLVPPPSSSMGSSGGLGNGEPGGVVGGASPGVSCTSGSGAPGWKSTVGV